MVRGVALLMVAILIGSAVTYYMQWGFTGGGEDEPPPQAKAPTAKPAPVAPPTGVDVATAYFLKLGGQKVMDDIKSVIVTGTLTRGDQVYTFEMMKKAPNLVRFEVADKVGTLMLGNDGQDAWVAYRDAGGQVKTWDADPATRDWLWLQGPMGTWLAHPDSMETQFALETPAADSAKPLTAVSVVSPAGRKATYYLEPETLRAARLELRDVAPGAVAQAADLEDFRLAQNKVWLPYKLVMQGPNGSVDTLDISLVRFNAGMLNATFERPVPDETGAAQPAILPTTVADNSPVGTGGQSPGPNLQQSFDANPVRVHNFVAQTDGFNTPPSPRIVEDELPTDGRPVLADYGFPWPLPW